MNYLYKNLFVLLTSMFLFMGIAYADELDNDYTNTTGNGEYAITKYNIDITVNENNTLDINEDITAYFNVEKHGIFRKLPLKNKVVRLDGTTSYNRVKISNIKVNEQYTLYSESGNMVMKIGDPYYAFTGSKEYNISYLYNLGKDTGKNYDELYYNIIGTECDTTISNVTFTINMPKEFDKTKLGFSSGLSGFTDSSNITYEVVGNIITGKYNGVLNPKEALTIRLELPDKYFVGASNNFDFIIILSIIVPILFALLSFCLWKKYGKDKKVIETVEFYPPEDFNSAKIGFLYKGKTENEDVISLLIYLANKGYIKICEIKEETSSLEDKGFKLIKLREYDGNDENEKMFFNGLFESKNEVTAEDLFNKFYKVIQKIKINMNNRANKLQIFEKSSLGKGFLVVLMIIITLFLIVAWPMIKYEIFEFNMYSIIFPIIGFQLIMLVDTFFKKTLKKIITQLFLSILCFGFPLFLFILPIIEIDLLYVFPFIIGFTCIIIMVILFKIMPKRTIYGNEILGKISGFKRFLETAEKPKLEELVMQNPTYFYNILPYTYALGVSDVWVDKFKTIALQSPDWYDSSTAFNTSTFSTFFDSTMASIDSAMSSSPSSSDSGGGSSGGGSGGGGVGSW